MSAIIEPVSADWWPLRDLTVVADRNLDGVLIVPKGCPPFGIQLKDLPEVEAALLNARLWLERATKQAAELKAAEEIAEDGPQELVCMNCGHPFHARQECEECGCDGHPHCSICEHRERSHYSTLNGCTAITRTGAICACPGFHLYTYQES